MVWPDCHLLNHLPTEGRWVVPCFLVIMNNVDVNNYLQVSVWLISGIHFELIFV